MHMTANPGELRGNPLQLSFDPFAVNGRVRSRDMAHFGLKLAQTRWFGRSQNSEFGSQEIDVNLGIRVRNREWQGESA